MNDLMQRMNRHAGIYRHAEHHAAPADHAGDRLAFAAHRLDDRARHPGHEQAGFPAVSAGASVGSGVATATGTYPTNCPL